MPAKVGPFNVACVALSARLAVSVAGGAGEATKTFVVKTVGVGTLGVEAEVVACA